MTAMTDTAPAPTDFDELPEADHDEYAYAVCREWGWDFPGPEVLQLAHRAIRVREMRTGEALVDLGLLSRQRVEDLLARKPPGVQSMTWLMQQEPAITPYADQILALKGHVPFYESLAFLNLHPAMTKSEVLRQADQLDALLMAVQGGRAVLVFSSFQGLITFRTMGRGEARANPLLQVAGDMPLYAVGGRSDISRLLHELKAGQGGEAGQESTAIWYPNDGDEDRLLARFIDDAARESATDLALQPERNGEYQVLMRRFGKLTPPRVGERISAELAPAVLRRLMAKTGAMPDGFSVARDPRDGAVSYQSHAGRLFLRTSFLPLNHSGESRNLTSVSVRLLSQSETSITFDALNIPGAVREQLEFAMELSQGLILVTGPTNSGKSTTIDAALGQHIATYGRQFKRIGIHDPVERYIAGMSAQVNLLHNLRDKLGQPIDPYEANLRAILRHDPDLVNIGEIRDRMTAGLTVTIANTGHLAFSTLHANTPRLALERLGYLIDPELRFQLAEALSLILSQRLIPTLCPHCRRIAATTDADRHKFQLYLQRLGESSELPERLARPSPKGCDQCYQGYAGMLPVFEVLPFDRTRKEAAVELMAGRNTRAVIEAGRTTRFLDGTLPLLGEFTTDLHSVLI